jgi:hypothetical protein
LGSRGYDGFVCRFQEKIEADEDLVSDFFRETASEADAAIWTSRRLDVSLRIVRLAACEMGETWLAQEGA